MVSFHLFYDQTRNCCPTLDVAFSKRPPSEFNCPP